METVQLISTETTSDENSSLLPAVIVLAILVFILLEVIVAYLVLKKCRTESVGNVQRKDTPL